MRKDVFKDFSKSEIRLQYQGDLDKQFQFLYNGIIRSKEYLEDEIAKLKKNSGSGDAEVVESLLEDIASLRKENEVLNTTVMELSARFDAFVPVPDSDSLKPDLFEESEVVEEKSKSKKK